MLYGSVLINKGKNNGGGGSSGWNPTNKSVLEKFGATSEDPSRVTWNGELVGEPSRETSLVVQLTTEMIALGYLELPQDCDTSEGQPVVVMYGNITPEQGTDWALELHDMPQLDRVVWSGFPLAAALMPDTELTVTYYKML